MIGNTAIRVLDESRPGEIDCIAGGEIMRLTLDVFGEPVDLLVGVENKQVRLADIVPLARAVSAKITEAVSKMVRLSGARIPCCKGCSACCNYLVPLAIPEVFRLREEIFAMPLIRQQLLEEDCLSATQRILDQRPPALFGEAGSAGATDSAGELLSIASDWYTDFGLQCPFLYRSICTIYEERPMACREYSVTGCSRACAGGAGEPQGINMPTRMSEALGRLASELEGTKVEALILPMLLIWADENPQRDQQRWPAPMMVERLFEIVKEALPKSSAEVIASPWG